MRVEGDKNRPISTTPRRRAESSRRLSRHRPPLMPPKGDRPRFPAARIKKMMQADEDVGRIAAGVPPLVCELLPCPHALQTPIQELRRVAGCMHSEMLGALRSRADREGRRRCIAPGEQHPASLAHVRWLAERQQRPSTESASCERCSRERAPPATLAARRRSMRSRSSTSCARS